MDRFARSFPRQVRIPYYVEAGPTLIDLKLLPTFSNFAAKALISTICFPSLSSSVAPQEMKKVVLKLEVNDDKCKQKAMKTASSLSDLGFVGLESLSMEMKDKKLTMTGDVDSVEFVKKLRKVCFTDIVSIGPVKELEREEEPKKEEPKKEEAKKAEEKKDPVAGV